MKISKALLAAGYSPSVAKRGGTVSVNMRAALQKAKDQYIAGYLSRCERNGTTPEFVADTVKEVMVKGDYDQKMSAVGQHLKVILSRSDALLDHSPSGGNLTINQNFIVPQTAPSVDDWQKNAVPVDQISTAKTSKSRRNKVT